MNIKPFHVSIGDLFGGKSLFIVPKYQRGYAWSDEAVSDFIADINICFEKRFSGSPLEHFFGGILSIKSDIEGVANESQFELVDGQQRVTTLSLLAFVLCDKFEELKRDPESDGVDNQSRIDLQSSNLRKSFLEHNQVANKVVRRAHVLTLSKKDDKYFRALLSGSELKPSIDSHEKLLGALTQLKKFVSSVLVPIEEMDLKLEVLECFQDVLLIDFSVLHMVAENKPDAYRLFQVINDRGVSLTDGDLLRVKTLELLEGFHSEQAAVEEIWDDILSDKPTKTYEYLQWIFESHAFRRARSGALADVFMAHFLGDIQSGNIEKKDAKKILSVLRKLHSDIELCRRITSGEWIYQEKRPVTPWDRTRLRTLVVDLGHTLCVPLLLAASELDHVKFRDIVLMLERSFFRYKIICNEHVTPLKGLYYSESAKIRGDVNGYKVDSIRSNLNELLDERAPVTNFLNGLRALTYQAKTGGNKSLKHFLLSLECYGRWVDGGAKGNPVCLEGHRILDFGETSIEHIYPRNALMVNRDAEMELRKNSIGNLTLLDPEINSSAENKPFSEKRAIFKASSISLNLKIGAKRYWNLKSSLAYEKELIFKASLIFRA